MELQFGDIFLVSRRGLIGELIKWHTHSQWTHTGIVIEPCGLILEATFPEVRYFNIDKYTEKGYKVAILRLKDFSLDKTKGLEYLLPKLGTRYDYFGFLSFLLNRKIGNKSFYFCSELAHEFIKSQGSKITRKDSSFVTPEDIWNTLAMDVVLEINSI